MPVPLTTTLLFYAVIMTQIGIDLDSDVCRGIAIVLGVIGVLNQLLVVFTAPDPPSPKPYDEY